MAKPSSTPKIVTKKHIARLERERQQVRLIQIIAIAAITIVVLLVGYGILDLNYLRYQKSVAEVNGEAIKVGAWQERIQFARLNLANNLQQYQYYQQLGMDTSQQIQQIQLLFQSPETLGQQVLDQMVNEVLIAQKAQSLGITVSDAEVEEAIQSGLNYFPNGTPTPTVTPTSFSFPTLTSKQLTLYPATATPTEAFTSTPAPTNTPDTSVTATATAPATPTFVPEVATATSTPYTLDGFKSEYSKSLDSLKGFGISESTFRVVYKNQLLRKKLLDEITKDTPHTAEQVWARHILIDNEADATAAYQLLITGADFAKIAQERSKDTGSGANGGDLGWFAKGAMVPEFEQAAFSQPVGEVGKPVKSQFGYHIIQVLARQQLPVSASEYENLKQTAFTDWLTKTTEDAKTAGTLTIFDIWKDNLPAMPAALTQQQ